MPASIPRRRPPGSRRSAPSIITGGAFLASGPSSRPSCAATNLAPDAVAGFDGLAGHGQQSPPTVPSFPPVRRPGIVRPPQSEHSPVPSGLGPRSENAFAGFGPARRRLVQRRRLDPHRQSASQRTGASMSGQATAAIIVIGNEVLSGKVVESNARFLVDELRTLGMP